MRRKTFATLIIIGCLVCAAGCRKVSGDNNQNITSSGKNVNQNETYTQGKDSDSQQIAAGSVYETAAVIESESDGVKYVEESGKVMDIKYPMINDAFSGEELVTRYKVLRNSSSVQNVNENTKYYKYVVAYQWEGLYKGDNIRSIEYNTYNSRCWFEDIDYNISGFLKEDKLESRNITVEDNDDEKLKLVMFVELPTLKEAWYGYKQSPQTENEAICDILNNVIITADVTYKDGTKKTDHYRLETLNSSGTSMNIYRLIP